VASTWSFADPETDEERAIKCPIDEYRKGQVTKLETEIFAQRKRQADAARKLAAKQTKAAAESMRIETGKVQQAMRNLSLLADDKPDSNDYRIVPKNYAPIILVRNGEKAWCRHGTCFGSRASRLSWTTSCPATTTPGEQPHEVLAQRVRRNACRHGHHLVLRKCPGARWPEHKAALQSARDRPMRPLAGG
jgi:hypothetical protein